MSECWDCKQFCIHRVRSRMLLVCHRLLCIEMSWKTIKYLHAHACIFDNLSGECNIISIQTFRARKKHIYATGEQSNRLE